MAAFDQLCETFPDENCVLTSREILVEVTAFSFSLFTYFTKSITHTYVSQPVGVTQRACPLSPVQNN